MKDKRKEYLSNTILKNSNNGKINLTEFRKNFPSEYANIAYYFGNINSMLSELNLTKITKHNNERVILRDKLAFEMLKQLRRNYTLEEIGKMYNVTKPLVNQLFNSLEIKIRSEKIKENLREWNTLFFYVYNFIKKVYNKIKKEERKELISFDS